jgi:ABC-type microcin C transport system permease subunit YejB
VNPTEGEESGGILFGLVGRAVAIFLIGSLVVEAMTTLEGLGRRFF